MEFAKPAETLARTTIGVVAGAGRYALKQMLGGRWAELADQYGEAVGGHKPHPASITYYTTPEIPENIEVGTE